MPLGTVIVTLIVIGVGMWLINLIPMQSTIKSILNAVVVIAVVLWLLYGFGIITHSGDIHVPKIQTSSAAPARPLSSPSSTG